MFWSKIWFFVVAVGAAIALTVALVMPRPAQRAAVQEETRRLTVACGVINILLEGDARNRVDLAGKFARNEDIERELADASAQATLDEKRMKTVRGIGETVMDGIKGKRNPAFAILIDRKGRVVARVRYEDSEFGDVLAGRPLVDDALAGYLRDDIWMFGRTTFLVAASPVIKGTEYVGAIVLGHKIDTEFAKKIVGKSLLVELGFYLNNDTLAATEAAALEQSTMAQGVAKLKGPELATDCTNDINTPLAVRAGGDSYSALVARLPGEAGARGAFYSVFAKKPAEIGFGATLGGATKDDLGFGSFPWILVGGGFLLALGVGIFLMLFEADRPLRRLAADTVKLAKGDSERLAEDIHPGKFGSIARSVNIHIDKLGREAKTAKKDLDQLLGPAPEGSLGTIDLLATALPSIRPGGAAPAVSPPPSEFRFGDSGSQPARMPTPPPSRPGTPPPVRKTPPAFPAISTPTPQPRPPQDLVGTGFEAAGNNSPSITAQSAPPLTLDDDILGGSQAAQLPKSPESSPRVDPYFRQVYDQFLAVKKSCNEPTSGLTYEKFSEKLVKNRDDLIAKTGCREVRFTVYIKEGKAALKATPVKEE
ncbi:MAG: hypothetical protein H0V17_03250 [Deltaproteobacteria bacterium]|nr:hypothetical protein [Deltaproteobacteria bacterium]